MKALVVLILLTSTLTTHAQRVRENVQQKGEIIQSAPVEEVKNSSENIKKKAPQKPADALRKQ